MQRMQSARIAQLPQFARFTRCDQFAQCTQRANFEQLARLKPVVQWVHLALDQFLQLLQLWQHALTQFLQRSQLMQTTLARIMQLVQFWSIGRCKLGADNTCNLAANGIEVTSSSMCVRAREGITSCSLQYQLLGLATESWRQLVGLSPHDERGDSSKCSHDERGNCMTNEATARSARMTNKATDQSGTRGLSAQSGTRSTISDATRSE